MTVARSPRTAPRIVVQRQGTRGAPNARDLKAWALAALAGRTAAAQITIRVVGTDEMTDLNLRYRGRAAPTNVLSFPLAMPAVAGGGDQSATAAAGPHGDIVVCAPVVAAEAAAQHKPLAAHWAHLTVHAVLHLLGHDHARTSDAALMEAREVAVLAGFGIPDPYVVRSAQAPRTAVAGKR